MHVHACISAHPPPTNPSNRPNHRPDELAPRQVEPDELDMIDHVLLSPLLAERIAAVYMYHGYPEGCDILDSDHWPVVVDFDFGAAGHKQEVAV